MINSAAVLLKEYLLNLSSHFVFLYLDHLVKDMSLISFGRLIKKSLEIAS